MLDAFIIDKMQKQKEVEEGKPEPLTLELPVAEDKEHGDQEEKKKPDNEEVTFRF